MDKLRLYSDMLKLPKQMGGQVAEIIRAREPGHSVPDLVEIDFDILKPSTLAALQSLVVSRKRQVADETKEPKEHKKEEVDESRGVARKKPRKEKHRESKVSQEQVKHKESRDPVAESQAEDLEILLEPDSSKSAYDFFVASMLLKMSKNVSEEKVGLKFKCCSCALVLLQVSKLCAEKWKNMSDEEKEVFVEMEDQEKHKEPNEEEIIKTRQEGPELVL